MNSEMIRAVALASALAACGGGGQAENGSDAGVTPAPDAAPITGVGDRCATGCIGSDICANDSDDCEHGYCLFDGRTDAAASYCTLDCTDSPCPAGYHCEDVPFAITRACVADEAVCGNGTVERGEACDDGNTASDDGCRGDCQATDTPLGEQRRVVASVTVSGSYVPEGGAATSLEMAFEIDAQLNADGDDCGAAFDTAAGNGPYPWRRFALSGCDAQARAVVSLSVPYRVGDYPADSNIAPRLCASLQLPPPDDARLGYCVQSFTSGQSLNVATVSGASEAGTPTGATGTFEGLLEYVPDTGIGGCDGSYAPSSCPAEPPATLTVAGSIELRNTN